MIDQNEADAHTRMAAFIVAERIRPEPKLSVFSFYYVKTYRALYFIFILTIFLRLHFIYSGGMAIPVVYFRILSPHSHIKI